MKKLNKYINEAWSGVKKQSNIENIKSWCDKMGIENYTINSKGEIDVEGNVDLSGKNFEGLPYKFGRVEGFFSLSECKNLKTLKNCPDIVEEYFSIEDCKKLNSIEGCPKEVGDNFHGSNCKIAFTEKEIKSLCKVKGDIYT